MTRGRAGDERGQAMVEYLMVSGLITAVAIAILSYTLDENTGFRRQIRNVADYVLGQALNPPY